MQDGVYIIPCPYVNYLFLGFLTIEYSELLIYEEKDSNYNKKDQAY